MYFLIGIGIFIALLFCIKVFIFPFYIYPDWMTSIPIAHRGLFNNKEKIPENSLLAFQKAIDRGYAIELDVHLTKDKQLIVHHDASLKRLTNKDKSINELILKEIYAYCLLETHEQISTLQRVFDLVKGQVPLYIEIKKEVGASAGNLEEILLEHLKKYNGPFALLSFNPLSLAWFAKKAPNYYRGQNYKPQGKIQKKGLRLILSMLTQSVKARPHFFVYNHRQIPGFFLKVLSWMRPLLSYNVKSLGDLKQASLYADNVIFENISP